MKATLRTHHAGECHCATAEVSMSMTPEEIEGVPDDDLSRTAEWTTSVARALWVQVMIDIDNLVEVDSAVMPDSTGDLPADLRSGDPE